MEQCNLCDKVLGRKKYDHYFKVHKVNKYTYIKKFILKIDDKLFCACGCNEEVTDICNGKINKYIHGHNSTKINNISDKVNKLYIDEGKTMNEVANELNINIGTVLRYLKSNNKSRSYSQSKQIYKINENVFEIDKLNEISVYLLGIFYSDGYLSESKNSLVLSISKKDEIIIDNLKKILKTDKPTRYFTKNEKEYCKFVIENKKITNDLIKIGLYSNKTFTIDMPKLNSVLIRHFIRGYFDGDGTILHGNRSSVFSITSNIKIVTSIQKILMQECNLLKTKFAIRRKKSPNIVTMNYGGNRQVRRIYDYLYKDSNIFLPRKKEKFEKFIIF